MKTNKKSKAAKGKLRRIVVEPADNGYTVTADHEPTGNAKESYMDYDSRAEKTVHPDANSVADHIKTKLSSGKDRGTRTSKKKVPAGNKAKRSGSTRTALIKKFASLRSNS